MNQNSLIALIYSDRERERERERERGIGRERERLNEGRSIDGDLNE